MSNKFLVLHPFFLPWLATILQIEMLESPGVITKALGPVQALEGGERSREGLMITHLYRYIEAEDLRAMIFDLDFISFVKLFQQVIV